MYNIEKLLNEILSIINIMESHVIILPVVDYFGWQRAGKQNNLLYLLTFIRMCKILNSVKFLTFS